MSGRLLAVQEKVADSSAVQRIMMTQKAIKPIQAFRLLTIELERPGVSYTIDTLRSLQDPSVKLYLLLSEESFATFHQWKEPKEILKIAQPLIGCRHLPRESKAIGGLTETAPLDISSTRIRERLKKKLYCGHLVPAHVLNYIEKEGLYCS